MCNYIHEQHEPIEPNGIGYKMFTVHNEYQRIECAFNAADYVDHKLNAIDPCEVFVEWVERLSACTLEGGFCFFLSEEEAIRCYLDCYDCLRSRDYHIRIAKIEYRRGLCKQIEDGIKDFNEYETALCKEFKILEWINLEG